MRILFICSSQRPGACGVGDYTRRLASACEERGIRCGIVSLNDPDSKDVDKTDGANLRWRWGADEPWKNKAFKLRQIVAQFAPDWVSLQFVPYGFHPRGLCRDLVKILEGLPATAQRHIFFHELFLGLHRKESLKNRAIGDLQRRIIRHLLRDWKPRCVHSHAAPYVAWLQQQHENVRTLPLCGNISIVSVNGPVAEDFDRCVKRRQRDEKSYCLGGYFGTFYPDAADDKFVTLLRRFAQVTNRQVFCFLAGRQDAAARERWRALEATSDETLSWIFLGEMNAACVSRYLQQLDFGIAATPWALSEKSGSIAAMREHGLPVLVPRNDWIPRIKVERPKPEGLFPAWRDDAVLEKLMISRDAFRPVASQEIAPRFLDDLSSRA